MFSKLPCEKLSIIAQVKSSLKVSQVGKGGYTPARLSFTSRFEFSQSQVATSFVIGVPRRWRDNFVAARESNDKNVARIGPLDLQGSEIDQ